MRKILVVVVIASAACLEPLEPAPQTPVSTGTVEHTAPPAGMDWSFVPGVADGTFGPVIASGTEAGRPWSMRGRIDARDAATFVHTSTAGGGGKGPLPFQDLGWKKLGHFGGLSSGEHGMGAACTLSLTGVVSKQTAAIEVRLADGTSMPARIIDTGDPRASFFVAVWSTPSQWEALIARDAAGAELETYHPFPTQAPPTQACATRAIPTQGSATQGSATFTTATRASATSTP